MENYIVLKPISLKKILKETNLTTSKSFYETSDDLFLKDVDGNYIWLDMLAEYPDSIYGFIRYGGNNVHNIINTIEKVSGQTIYSEHHRYYPYIFEGTFDDGFNSVDEIINLIEHDLVSDNPLFEEEY